MSHAKQFAISYTCSSNVVTYLFFFLHFNADIS